MILKSPGKDYKSSLMIIILSIVHKARRRGSETVDNCRGFAHSENSLKYAVSDFTMKVS